MKTTTEPELMAKLAALEPLDEDTRRKVTCALVGHSKIQTTFFGYFYCGRCRQQVGDSLGAAYKATDVVIVGHNCDACRKNHDALGWEHKVFVGHPFIVQIEAK